MFELTHLDTAPVPELIVVASAEPPLDEEEEAQLAQRVHAGDPGALEALVLRSVRVAIDEAIKSRGLGSPQELLVRRAIRELVSAARDYHPEQSVRFSRYARDRIRSALRKAVVTS